MGNNEWVSTTLGELVDTFGGSVQTGPFGSQLHAADYVSEGIPSVMPKNIKIEEIDVEDIAKVSLSDAERLKKYQLAEGDIVYSRRGDVEKCALVTKNEANWLCGTGCLRIRIPRNKSITPYFLHAFLSTPVTREWVSRHAIGATMPNLNTSILRDVPIVVPPFDSMNFIGAMWIKLNRKIILNRKINQTLEQMSQTLFKSWFVDFDPVIDNALDAGKPIPEALQSRAELRQKERNSADFKRLPADVRALFPTEFEETELGWVPKGWSIENFSEIAQLVKENVKSEAISTYVHYVGLEHLERKHIFITNYGNGSDVSSNKTAFSKGDLLFGKLRPYFHKVAITPFSGICSTDILVFRAKKKYYKSLMAMYAFTDEFVAYANLRSTGTRMPRAEAKDLLKYKIVLPNENILEKFELLLNDYWSKGQLNNNENKQLTALRDTLLPKLISGELSLEDLPDLIKQTEVA